MTYPDMSRDDREQLDVLTESRVTCSSTHHPVEQHILIHLEREDSAIKPALQKSGVLWDFRLKVQESEMELRFPTITQEF